MAQEDQESGSYEFTASDGQSFAFTDLNAALQYAEDERQKWDWLARQDTVREFNSVLSPLHLIVASLDAVLSVRPTNNVPAAVLDQPVRAGLADYFGWKPAIHSRAPLQSFLMEVSKRSEKEALWTLGWLAFRAGVARKVDVTAASLANQNGVMTGMASAWQWDGRRLANDGAEETLASVQRVAGEIHSLRDQAVTVLDTAKSAMAGINGQAYAGRVAVQQSGERLEQFSAELADKLNEVVTERGIDLEAKWHDLTKTYSESLKLKAPAKYWGEKQTTHRRQSLWYAVASISFAVFAGGGLCWAYYRLLGTSSPGTTLPPWGELMPCAVLAVVFLWVLRTLMRLTMSHVHLALDAEERQIMVQCYLAMTNEGETSGDERRALFAAIFRPTGDGIVKDESPPIPMWEMLKAAKSKSD